MIWRLAIAQKTSIQQVTGLTPTTNRLQNKINKNMSP
jgi:hypothetical protein